MLKKCCPVCWELGNVLRAKFNLDIALSGSHSVSSPWAPPEWLSGDVDVCLEATMLIKLEKS